MHPLHWSVTHSLCGGGIRKTTRGSGGERNPTSVATADIFISIRCFFLFLVATVTPTAPTIAPALPCHRARWGELGILVQRRRSRPPGKKISDTYSCHNLDGEGKRRRERRQTGQPLHLATKASPTHLLARSLALDEITSAHTSPTT